MFQAALARSTSREKGSNACKPELAQVSRKAWKGEVEKDGDLLEGVGSCDHAKVLINQMLG